MDGHVSRTRKADIEDHFTSLMNRFLWALDVVPARENARRRVHTAVSESGSILPRALLAYYYSFLHTIAEYGTSTFCPVVIDSPKQQDQDDLNWPRMLDFMQSHQPAGSQVILALVDDAGANMGGETICLTEKYRLLQNDQFESVSEELRPFLDATWGYE